MALILNSLDLTRSMSDSYDILVIDDEADTWLPALKPAAEAHGCTLLGAATVGEGMALLEHYDAVIDAVVLDLAFPGSGLQGKEGLREIKEAYPQRPVLILTSSGAAEDIRTAVECVRMGAYDYFPKERLDAQQLFLQARQAIEQEREAQRHEALARQATPDTEEPFVLACEVSSDDGPVRHVRHFALALHSLVKTRGKEEKQEATESAVDWHRQLLSFLALSQPEARFRLRYIAAPVGAEEGASEDGAPELRVVLIATVEAAGAEKAARQAALLHWELMVYLMGKVQVGARVYTFVPVTSEEQLKKCLVPIKGRKGLRLARSTVGPVALSEGHGMGFVADAARPARAQLPLPASTSLTENNLSHFCRLMAEQRGRAFVEVSLRPTKLSAEELDRLRRIARGEAAQATGLSQQEDEALTAFSERLIRQAARCFEIDLCMAQGQEAASSGLEAAVASGFFGDGSGVDAEQAYLEVTGGALSPLPPASGNGDRLARLYAPDEAMRLFRLPLPTSTGFPGIRPAHPVYDFLPKGLSSEGPLLGGKLVQSAPREVRLHPEDMLHHVYILGQTGTGKTTMLGTMMVERLVAGAGLGLIDPHGDLCGEILQVVPEDRRDDVILFDPTDEKSDIKLNLLEYDPRYPRQRSTLINELFQVFHQEYDREALGPIFENYMRNALLLVMDDPEEPGTLMDVVRLFQEKSYREVLLKDCDNERVAGFWKQAEDTPSQGELPTPGNVSIYITSKLSRFIDDDYLRSLISQRRSTLDFRDLIDSGKILLVKMSKGKLGDLGVKMFGTIIFARLLMAALSREDLPKKERRDFFLFVDEFQNFTTPSIASLLSEARKYRLSLTLANQTLFQLSDAIVNGVLGNVGSLVTLRPGVKDYPTIEPYVTPPFKREDVVNLPNYTAVARLLVGRQPTAPFMFQTIPLLDEYLAGGSTAR